MDQSIPDGTVIRGRYWADFGTAAEYRECEICKGKQQAPGLYPGALCQSLGNKINKAAYFGRHVFAAGVDQVDINHHRLVVGKQFDESATADFVGE